MYIALFANGTKTENEGMLWARLCLALVLVMVRCRGGLGPVGHRALPVTHTTHIAAVPFSLK